MDDLQVESYLLKKPETSLDYPFGEDCKVFKVKGKMFETLSLGTGNEKGTDGEMARCHCMNLKCDPDEASMLRDIFPSEIPGYHMTKIYRHTHI